MTLQAMPLCSSDYILCSKIYYLIQEYITGDYILTSSEIFIELKSLSLVSDLYGLIRRILYLIFVGPYCKCTVPLVKQCVITKEPLYGVSYLYTVWLVSMTLSLTL